MWVWKPFSIHMHASVCSIAPNDNVSRNTLVQLYSSIYKDGIHNDHQWKLFHSRCRHCFCSPFDACHDNVVPTAVYSSYKWSFWELLPHLYRRFQRGQQSCSCRGSSRQYIVCPTTRHCKHFPGRTVCPYASDRCGQTFKRKEHCNILRFPVKFASDWWF